MGIPGLTKYINERSDRCMKPFQLKNTLLVIDGCNLVSQLYCWHTRSLSAFGGDYDVYERVVRDFFTNLRKCNVTPIVIFDGGYERKKLKTVHKRRKSKMEILFRFNQSFCTEVFFPLLIQNVFVSVLEDLDINCVQCFFEADREIAALARHLNCPILSYDSDFFIFDVLYIPFDTVDVDVTESNGESYLSCCMFDLDAFLSEFRGLQKDSLPLLPVLLGNDYVDKSVFKLFFNHVGIKNDNGSSKQGRIHGLLHWLKRESLQSAIQGALSHIRKSEFKSASNAINSTIDDYTPPETLILPLLRLESEDKSRKPLLYDDHELIRKLPERFIVLYQKGSIPGEFMDIINLNRYYVRAQVEDVKKQSCQMISIPLIGAIHKILDALTGVRSSLVLYLKNLMNFDKLQLTNTADDYFAGVDTANIMTLPARVRTGVMYRVLSMSEDDVEVVEKFQGGWKIFIMSLIFWLKNSTASSAHFHSILLMIIANYIQVRVGHFKSYRHFMRSKAGQLNRLSKSEIPVGTDTEQTFPNLLNCITELETLLFTQKFIKLRQWDQEVTKQGYFISTIHLFASLQSVLLHVSELNILMDFPFPDIKFQEFYSGTLLYNLYLFLNRKEKLISFVNDILSEMPNVLNLYEYFNEVMSGYIPEKAKVEKATRMKKRFCKRKRGRRH